MRARRPVRSHDAGPSRLSAARTRVEWTRNGRPHTVQSPGKTGVVLAERTFREHDRRRQVCPVRAGAF